MDLAITLAPDGNTTPSELAALADEVEQALQAEHGITYVRRPESPVVTGAKGIAQVIGSFLVGVPPGAISGALGLVRAVLARSPDTPTKVKVTADGGVEMEFDPRRTTPEQMLALVNGLHPQAKPS